MDESRITAARERLIVALDVESASEARSAVRELRESAGAFKVGLQLFTSAGPGLVRELVEEGIKVFLDVKYHDIPNTVAKASIEAARLGVWMFNIHTSGGPEMMKAASYRMREFCDSESIPRPKLIGVTVLTSSNEDTLYRTGIRNNVADWVLHLAGLAAECGLDGIVASPQETSLIRRAVKNKEFCIVTPGIRSGDATSDDQKRVMSAEQAISTGSDYLVVGRPIMHAEDRPAAAASVIRQIESALASNPETSISE